MTIIVTGGAGFIGSNFIFHMLDKYPDYRIVCLDCLTYAGNLSTLAPVMDNPNFRFVKESITDREAVYKLFEEEHPDMVVNFAAESHVDRSIENPEVFLDTNIKGTAVLMDACRKYGIKRYHQVSTDEVYGDLPLDRPDLFFTEETPIHTSSPYSSSKAGADLLVLAYHRTYGLPVTISRCSNNYGPYHFPEKLIPLMIENVCKPGGHEIMKVLVTGVAGQLGHDVMNELAKRGYEGIGSDIAKSYNGIQDGTPVVSMPYVQMDITDKASVEKVLTEVNADAVIHCAAWTAVDLAEDEDKKDKVHAVNAEGTKNIAEVCKKLDSKMVYTSTDYVFNGQGEEPWQPDCKDYQPLNVYGQSKLDGELAVSETLDKYFIVRIAWVFGKNGNNFIKTMLKVGKNHDKLRVVNDQIGTPTYTFDLARLLVDMIETDKYGYYHATNEGGYISWYDFTKEIFRQAVEQGHTEYGEDRITVDPVTTAEYGVSKAARPFNSRLDKKKLVENGFTPLPTWQDALGRYLKELNIGEL